ncbi:MAG: retention module-containing protein, partial [Luminiphilus sp.]|nr:retention module-containing protein [Luminiphilus sp.]
MAQLIGTVSKLTGNVTARAPDGSVRELSLGDDVYQGEVLVTAQGAIVEVTIPDAPAIVLPGGRELLLNGEVTVAGRDTAADAGLVDESLDQVVAALESGADINEILEETAAGGAGNEGSSFIRLGRIGLGTPSTSGETDATAAADSATSDAAFDGDLQLIEEAAEFSIDGGVVSEGSIITLTITRTGNTDIAASVDVATLVTDPATDSAEDNDFTALATTTVFFAEGQTEATIQIQTTQDDVLEGAETFRVGLSNPSAASPFDAAIADGGDIGTVTILDDGTGPGDNPDDDTTGFSVDSAEVLEGGVMEFTVTRTGDADFEQTVDFATSIEADDTAETNDFDPASGTLTFAPGEVTKTFTVQTTADAVYEGSETFTVTLSDNSEGSEILQPTGTGTILDGTSETVFSVDSVEVLEGGVMTFTIT